MNAQELAEMYASRMGDWKLDWEVLWITFQVLIDEGVKPELIEKALEEGLSEWDI